MFKSDAFTHNSWRHERLKIWQTYRPPSAHELGCICAHCNCRAPATSESNSVLFPQFTTSLKPFGRITFHFKIIPRHLSFPIVIEKPTLTECLLARMKLSQEMVNINWGFLRGLFFFFLNLCYSLGQTVCFLFDIPFFQFF